ncbi:hypothetical protein SCP_1302990 [Sparassis crispa]|uniref:Zn(2)-C6 fungal-type domain-containing protein n=1 Tax=Sparassis crispa TaxID=139825 RepID=A0A401H264_9APHY|nr:hypothetical protein SCP_1302990 [Sparassis crispa]GBE88483.1 hypothetical protein SCP_1302990 [Sparassis crispa]
MTHLLPPHADLNLNHSSLQSALQIDPNQQPPPAQQPQAPPLQPPPQSRKRRKADTNGDDGPHPAEPRRLRRSHEACARCRSKKIKCDSKHPRCTACATAGTACHQEDRHRQTLTPRGHTERIERQLLQCDALLKRRIPDFNLDSLDDICSREGIEVDSSDNALSTTFQFAQPPGGGGSNRPYPLRTEAPPPQPGSPPRTYPYGPPGQPMMHHYGAPPMMPYGPPPPGYGPPPPPPPHMAMHGPPPPGYNPHILPAFQHPLQPHSSMQRSPSSHDIPKGQDPLSHDMSSTQALAKSFGVHSAIVNEVKMSVMDREDLAVGSAGLTSGRDRDVGEPSAPRDATKWFSVSMRRDSTAGHPPSGLSGPASPSSNVPVWLPKDRTMLRRVLDVYFTRLNFHRPVFTRKEFEHTLDALYEGQTLQHDPGYVCSLYLILALGTLSELNHRVSGMEKERSQNMASPTTPKKLMPADWPEHEEFFQSALAVKPDLRVTVSSLQALILLQWYLYTERQGRTLWRLVGSLVRLSIELGLHHDPTSQDNVFSEEECQLRIRLWGIVLVHDRGTSILLGRPLAIAPSDSNTPRPSRSKSGSSDISEHFVLSAPIAEIQADIINSLYTPTRQSADAIMRHATRIIKSMVEFRRQLPDTYKWYFSGTEDWPLERRIQLVNDITEDQGLTLLKIGITRILLLRALFSSKQLQYHHRHRALLDAIVMSHNIIIVHNQLIRFPDIAFFVSPIPLHIAAMVILFGRMSGCDPIPRQVALEDVWMALDMLPSFRWRWERKDLNGGHPLIAKVAEKVLGVNLHQVAPTAAPMLMPEQDWDADSILSSKPPPGTQQQGVQPQTPTMGPAQYPAQQGAYAPPNGGSSGTGSPGRGGKGAPGTPADKKLAEVPAALFYPFYPETQNNAAVVAAAGNGGNGDFNHLLAAAAQPMSTYGYQPSQESYMLEEKDTSAPASSTGMLWMNHEQRPIPHFPTQTQQ